jgi:hypothetical protein
MKNIKKYDIMLNFMLSDYMKYCKIIFEGFLYINLIKIFIRVQLWNNKNQLIDHNNKHSALDLFPF